ncbi:MAG: TetR/AcrR family transcriptional regulator [Pseudooceanicola sp.]
MMSPQVPDAGRKRAPSKRALETRARVFDAAEKVFAARGFDGATVRDIAAEAGETVGTVHHHGGGKARLFRHVVTRRAEVLARARRDALDRLRAEGAPDVDGVLSAFMRPFFDLSAVDPGWLDYARLVAFVSADDRWKDISAEVFDPTASLFIRELRALLPDASDARVAEAFVFSVSAMLALLTSRGRIGDLGAGRAPHGEQLDHLVRFCAAGFRG